MPNTTCAVRWWPPRQRRLHHQHAGVWARKATAPHLPSHWQARLIEVQLGERTRRFITSLTDATRYPSRELAQLYAKRWEIELGFREIKQSLQAGAFVLRSKQHALVRQELWGVRSPTRYCAG
ncbi:MAG: hypothetical protein EON54_21430 [Alcaligenaceae bacterium]|nr:MAG: hypothetical protein EON54_21430 [Alcaligenaceae bacterium]